MADQAEKFWSDFERETGEKVEARSIGQWHESSDREPGLWGLLVLTDKSFRFKHMPSENWLLSLFKRAERSSEAEAPVDIVIPRGDLLAVVSPKRGFLGRLFGPAFPTFVVESRGEEGPLRYVFAVDPSQGFLAALERATPPAGSASGAVEKG